MRGLVCAAFLFCFSFEVAGQEVAQQWIGRLKSDDPTTRLRAAYDVPIEATDDASVKVLLQNLGGTDPFVVRCVASALGEIVVAGHAAGQVPEITLRLATLLESPYEDIRNHATLALVKCGNSAVEPLATALRKTDVIVEHYGRLGVNLRDDDAPEGDGVLVTGVQPQSAAAKGGIRVRDRITKIGWSGVSTHEGVLDSLKQYRAGSIVRVHLLRGGNRLTKSVVLQAGARLEEAPGERVLKRVADYAAAALIELEPEQLPDLDDMLQSESDRTRSYALQVLARRREALHRVRSELRNPPMRAFALSLLSDYGEDAKPAIPQLLELLAIEPNSTNRKALEGNEEYLATEALAAIGEDSADAIARELASQDVAGQLRLIGLLGRIEMRTPLAVSQLENGLESARPEVRLAAAIALARLAPDRPKAATVLAGALGGEDAYMAAQSLQMLGSAARGVTPQLINSFSREGSWRSAIVATIADSGDDALESLELGLEHPESEVRRHVVQVIARIGAPAKALQPKLMKLLASDEDTQVRVAAADALAKVDSPPDVNKLTEILMNGVEDSVRVEILQLLGTAESLPAPFVGRVVIDLGSKDPAVPRAAAGVLLKHREGVEAALLRALHSPNPVLRKNACLLLELVGSGDETVAALLERLTDSDPDVQRAALRGLGAVQPTSPAVVAGIIKMLASSKTKRDAVIALGRIGEEAKVAIPHLVSMLTNQDTEMHSAAIALARMGSGGVDELVKAFDHQSNSVRVTAAEAIGSAGAGGVIAVGRLSKEAVSSDEMQYTVLPSIDRILVGSEAEHPELAGLLSLDDLHFRVEAAKVLSKLPARFEGRSELLSAVFNDQAVVELVGGLVLEVANAFSGGGGDAAQKGDAIGDAGVNRIDDFLDLRNDEDLLDHFVKNHPLLARPGQYGASLSQLAYNLILQPSQKGGAPAGANPFSTFEAQDPYWAPSMWPPPIRYAAWDIYDASNLVAPGDSLGRVFSFILLGLKDAKVFENDVFAAPRGFAILTPLERMQPNGEPFESSSDSQFRWTRHKPTASNFSEYFRYMIFGSPGLHRCFLIAVTTEQSAVGGAAFGFEDFEEIRRKAERKLPSWLSEREYKNHSMHIVAYHFERRLGGVFDLCPKGGSCGVTMPAIAQLEAARVKFTRRVP